MSSIKDAGDHELISAGQLQVVASGTLGDDGLRYFVRARAIAPGKKPIAFVVWHDGGQSFEQPLALEVVAYSEMTRRVVQGEIGQPAGEMRGPVSEGAPHHDTSKHKSMFPSRSAEVKTSHRTRDRHAASSAGNPAWDGVGYAYANAELDRGERDRNVSGEIAKYTKKVEGKYVGRGKPQPMPAFVGQVGYYRARHNDFVRRHRGLRPPAYYLDYGEKYARRFTHVLFPELSGQGKAWLIRARMHLQLAIERKLLDEPEKFDEMERDGGELKAFAFKTHSHAYLEAGLASLSTADHVKIAATPELSDVLTPASYAQFKEAMPEVAARKLERAIEVLVVP